MGNSIGVCNSPPLLTDLIKLYCNNNNNNLSSSSLSNTTTTTTTSSSSPNIKFKTPLSPNHSSNNSNNISSSNNNNNNNNSRSSSPTTTSSILNTVHNHFIYHQTHNNNNNNNNNNSCNNNINNNNSNKLPIVDLYASYFFIWKASFDQSSDEIISFDPVDPFHFKYHNSTECYIILHVINTETFKKIVPAFYDLSKTFITELSPRDSTAFPIFLDKSEVYKLSHDVYIWNGKNSQSLTKALCIAKCNDFVKALSFSDNLAYQQHQLQQHTRIHSSPLSSPQSSSTSNDIDSSKYWKLPINSPIIIQKLFEKGSYNELDLIDNNNNNTTVNFSPISNYFSDDSTPLSGELVPFNSRHYDHSLSEIKTLSHLYKKIFKMNVTPFLNGNSNNNSSTSFANIHSSIINNNNTNNSTIPATVEVFTQPSSISNINNLVKSKNNNNSTDNNNNNNNIKDDNINNNSNNEIVNSNNSNSINNDSNNNNSDNDDTNNDNNNNNNNNNDDESTNISDTNIKTLNPRFEVLKKLSYTSTTSTTTSSISNQLLNNNNNSNNNKLPTTTLTSSEIKTTTTTTTSVISSSLPPTLSSASTTPPITSFTSSSSSSSSSTSSASSSSLSATTTSSPSITDSTIPKISIPTLSIPQNQMASSNVTTSSNNNNKPTVTTPKFSLNLSAIKSVNNTSTTPNLIIPSISTDKLNNNTTTTTTTTTTTSNSAQLNSQINKKSIPLLNLNNKQQSMSVLPIHGLSASTSSILPNNQTNNWFSFNKKALNLPTLPDLSTLRFSSPPQTPRGGGGGGVGNTNNMIVMNGNLNGSSPEAESYDKLPQKELSLYFEPILNKIVDEIYLGSRIPASNLQLLKSEGITHILNCAGMVCQNLFQDHFIYKTLFISDGNGEDITCLFYEILDFIGQAIASNGKVYIHCHQGISRSSAFVILYLMWKNKWNFIQAHEFTKRKRYISNPNPGFTGQLMMWRKNIDRNLSSSVREPSLYRMVQLLGNIVVPKKLSNISYHSLDARCCFILRVTGYTFLWVGQACQGMLGEKFLEAAKVAIRRFQDYENDTVNVIELRQGNETEEFWEHMGGEGGVGLVFAYDKDFKIQPYNTINEYLFSQFTTSTSSSLSSTSSTSSSSTSSSSSTTTTTNDSQHQDNGTYNNFINRNNGNDRAYLYRFLETELSWEKYDVFDCEDLVDDELFVLKSKYDKKLYIWIGKDINVNRFLNILKKAQITSTSTSTLNISYTNNDNNDSSSSSSGSSGSSGNNNEEDDQDDLDNSKDESLKNEIGQMIVNHFIQSNNFNSNTFSNITIITHASQETDDFLDNFC